MIERNATTKDDKYIEKATKRLLVAYERFGTWRAVGESLGVNHGMLVRLVRHGKVPKDTGIRLKLGLPRVMPSERRPRARRIMPKFGSDAWMELVLKKIKPKRRTR